MSTASKWTVTRIVYGAPWFVSLIAIVPGQPVRVSWSSDERDALRFDGATALVVQCAVAEREVAICYAARDGYSCVTLRTGGIR